GDRCGCDLDQGGCGGTGDSFFPNHEAGVAPRPRHSHSGQCQGRRRAAQCRQPGFRRLLLLLRISGEIRAALLRREPGRPRQQRAGCVGRSLESGRAMELALSSPAKKWTAAAVLLLATVGYTLLAARVFVGSLFSASRNLAGLERAARFDSGSAEYQNAVGVFQMVQQSPREALPWLESATSLNPTAAKYWLNLAVG